MSQDLPESWLSTGFLSIFDVQGGTQPPKSEFIYEARTGYVQLLQIRDFGERSVPTFIPDTMKLKKCAESDILIARYGASLGRILTGMSGAYNVAMAKVAIPELMDRRFVYHLLKAECFQAPLRLVSRSAQNGFNKEDLSNFELPLAPLPEQKRIADKLDSVLARVDACRDRLGRLPALLKRFRQSILAAATSGRLTEDWREANLPKRTWNATKLENLCTSVFDGPFGSNLKSDDYTSSGVRVVRLENIGHLYFEASKESYISDEKYQGLVKHSLQPDDILFSSFVDEEVRVCLYPAKQPTAAINKADCFCLRPDSSKCSPTYLSYRLASRATYVELKELVHGATRPRINLKQLRQYLVEVPELEEQTEIVRRVEILFAFADRLEARLATARRQVGQLTPALLAKAFRGELVAQDPADEPAAELLKRLAAQREAAPKVKRGRAKG